MKCTECGKEIKEPLQAGGLESVTEGYCKECTKKKDERDKNLIIDIKAGNDILKYLD